MVPIKVLVVDDSALIRQVVSELLSQDPNIDVVATAIDPFDAREKIKRYQPDVLTLDIEMPRMDGVTFLKNLMRLRPMPVVMISTLTTEGADVTLEALEVGAVDFIAKPTKDQASGLTKFQHILIEKVKMAASTGAQLQRIKACRRNEDAQKKLKVSGSINARKLIAIGSSTGGTEAVRDLLLSLPSVMPPIIITQHIPIAFSERFAVRLNHSCALTVKQAESGDVLEAGTVYVAPGDQHLEIVKKTHGLVCRLSDSDAVNRHKPSVEVMFDSLNAINGKLVSGVLLTGMGVDGAEAMKRLQQRGAHTIAQDEASSLVWGMPGKAVSLGAANEVLPLEKIAADILTWSQK